MKLKTKLPLVSIIPVLLSIFLVAAISIYNFRQKVLSDIEAYKIEETERIKALIKDMVDMAYDMLWVSYENARTELELQQLYDETDSLKTNKTAIEIDKALEITVENLRAMRFSSDGYIWINEYQPPYVVVMHAIKPELEGEANIFNVGKDKRNIYEVFAEICSQSGEGFLEYEFYKQGSAELMKKISYIKLFEKRSWVVGTGLYIDNIEKVVKAKTEALDEKIKQIVLLTILIGIVMGVLVSIALYFIGKNTTSPLSLIEKQLADMAKGISVEKLTFVRSDEIGDMKKSADLLIDGINAYSEFAKEIGKGNYDAQFDALSEKDILGNSLLEMRNSLKEAQIQEQKRHDENAKRNWATEGLARFGDILRENVNDISEHSYNVIKNLVDYLRANQAALFILNEDEENAYLELVAAVAYDRRRFLKKKVVLGDGVIGMVALEKATVYMTNIPNDYIEITSGLGTANPKSLLIVPLKLENNIFGILELASFNKFEEHEIEFVEKISENIAATLSSEKVNERTTRLLEEFKLQAAEKEAREREMRQNLEELQMLRERLKMEEEARHTITSL